MRRYMLALLSATSLGAPACAGAPVWTISEASQGVMISHAGLTKAAFRGGHAEPGDIISTGGNARAVLVRGEEYAVVAPNSRLQVADPAESSGLTQFIEKVGNVVFSIRKMATPHFGVQTPYLAAVVKGTTFSVTVDDSGASVQVVEGAVEVATNDGGAHEVLRPGGIASVGASDLRALTIRGSNNRTLRSPNVAQPARADKAVVTAVEAGDAGKVSAPMIAIMHEETAPPAAVGGSASSGSAAAAIEISNVQEKPTSLASLSDGLVANGNATTQAVIASALTSGSDRAAAIAITADDKGNGAGSQAVGGHGSSNGQSGANGNGGSAGSGNSGPGDGPGDNGNGGPGRSGGPGNNGNGKSGPGNGGPGAGPSGKGGPGNGSGGPGNNGNGKGGPGNGGPGAGPSGNGDPGNGPGGPGNNGNGKGGAGNGGRGGGPGGNGGPGNGPNAPGNNGNGKGAAGTDGPGAGPGNNGNGNGGGKGHG